MRTYKPRPTYRRARRDDAARLRGEGMSLREIAGQLGVSHETVRRDLAHLSHLPSQNPPRRGSECDTGCDSGAVVIPLRKTS